MPGTHEIDAGVVAAANAVQGEGGGAEGLLHGVFVVGALVDGAGFGEGGALGVGEEGGEVVVVDWRGWGGEFEEAAGERGDRGARMGGGGGGGELARERPWVCMGCQESSEHSIASSWW